VAPSVRARSSAFRPCGNLRRCSCAPALPCHRAAGTAFVQYHTKEGADSALSAASASDAHSATALPAGNVTSRDPRERKRAVIAGAVRSALSDGGVKIGSRVIMISRAVNKDEATKLAGGACTKSRTAASCCRSLAFHPPASPASRLPAGGDCCSLRRRGRLQAVRQAAPLLAARGHHPGGFGGRQGDAVGRHGQARPRLRRQAHQAQEPLLLRVAHS